MAMPQHTDGDILPVLSLLGIRATIAQGIFSPIGAVLMAASGFVLPDPTGLTLLIGAIGLGIGLAYKGFLNTVTPARIEAMKAMDEAHRTTTLAKLEVANRALAEANARDAESRRAIEENRLRLDALQRDLDEERERSGKLRGELEEFAIQILRQRGFLSEDDTVVTPPTVDPPSP